jgi:hypothetical protein
MKILFFFLILVSCGSPISNYNSNNENINFNGNLTFDDFKKLLVQYTKISPFPYMDNK